MEFYTKEESNNITSTESKEFELYLKATGNRLEIEWLKKKIEEIGKQ
jgi:hypothetical protein